MGGRRPLCRRRRVQADHRATVQEGISCMNRMEAMRDRLAVFDPVSLDISDESHKHAGHAGARDGGGHYVLYIVSAQFAGKNMAARHRMIYLALAEMMRSEIHALTIQAQAPDELYT